MELDPLKQIEGVNKALCDLECTLKNLPSLDSESTVDLYEAGVQAVFQELSTSLRLAKQSLQEPVPGEALLFIFLRYVVDQFSQQIERLKEDYNYSWLVAVNEKKDYLFDLTLSPMEMYRFLSKWYGIKKVDVSDLLDTNQPKKSALSVVQVKVNQLIKIQSKGLSSQSNLEATEFEKQQKKCLTEVWKAILEAIDSNEVSLDRMMDTKFGKQTLSSFRDNGVSFLEQLTEIDYPFSNCSERFTELPRLLSNSGNVAVKDLTFDKLLQEWFLCFDFIEKESLKAVITDDRLKIFQQKFNRFRRASEIIDHTIECDNMMCAAYDVPSSNFEFVSIEDLLPSPQSPVTLIKPDMFDGTCIGSVPSGPQSPVTKSEIISIREKISKEGAEEMAGMYTAVYSLAVHHDESLVLGLKHPGVRYPGYPACDGSEKGGLWFDEVDDSLEECNKSKKTKGKKKRMGRPGLTQEEKDDYKKIAEGWKKAKTYTKKEEYATSIGKTISEVDKALAYDRAQNGK